MMEAVPSDYPYALQAAQIARRTGFSTYMPHILMHSNKTSPMSP
jgi:hypothetical protein